MGFLEILRLYLTLRLTRMIREKSKVPERSNIFSEKNFQGLKENETIRDVFYYKLLLKSKNLISREDILEKDPELLF